MKSKMKKTRRTLRTLCLLSVIITLSLLSIVSSSCNMSVYALKRYGYGKGDEYRFVMEMSTIINSEEGTTTTSQSYEFIIKIKDVDEDADGYDIKIEALVVGSTGFLMGFYSQGGLMQETTIEGYRLVSKGGGPMGGFFNFFTSTDWDEWKDEWKDFVEGIGDQKGYRVREDSASNGVFGIRAEMDVDDDEPSAIDYDGDGDKDGYTGWFSLKGEYDNKGVLKSSVSESYMEFNKRNSVTHSFKIYRGIFSPLPREMFVYTAVVIASFVVAFVLGFFLGKRKTPKATSISTTNPTPQVIM